MTAAYVVLAGLFGAIIGSFLNVVVYRLPRGESLSTPGSRCPSCETPIKPYDNVPVLGWLWLRGRCRSCQAPISARYPLVEAATAVLCAGEVLANHNAGRALLGFVLVLVLVPITLIDLDHRLIPNRITAPAAVLALVIGTPLDPGGEVERLIAGAAAGGFLLIAALAYPRGMGMGDVKLAGVLGLFLGRAVGPAMLIALVAGVIVGVVIMRRAGVGAGRKTAIPFGPFLALGGLVGSFAGNAIVSAYLSSIGQS
ncbi:MAG: leader peptidase (prepilin peptidase) / N-methyltransferase [Solirubrobacteraceae bacterium]|jgi:leader peptidase (prepilin peptidase)/N-methyltransferase|nr:leader peptidase (prepilin peptidase) / N-methyltransferase [Solirubrobacteraceae bacterium]